MKFIHRLGYYLGGFAVGLIFLSFFLSGKKTSCSYSPQARTIKNINLKDFQFSDKANITLQTLNLSEDDVIEILKKGKINFSKSNTKLDSCKQYLIENRMDGLLRTVLVENCESIATVLEINPF